MSVINLNLCRTLSSTTPNIKDNKLKQQVNMDQVTQQLEAILQTANQSTLQQEMRGEYQGGMMENRGPSHTIEKTQVAPCS